MLFIDGDVVITPHIWHLQKTNNILELIIYMKNYFYIFVN